MRKKTRNFRLPATYLVLILGKAVDKRLVSWSFMMNYLQSMAWLPLLYFNPVDSVKTLLANVKGHFDCVYGFGNMK